MTKIYLQTVINFTSVDCLKGWNYFGLMQITSMSAASNAYFLVRKHTIQMIYCHLVFSLNQKNLF